MADVEPIHLQEESGKDIYLYPISFILNAINRTKQTYFKWENTDIIPTDYVIRIKLYKNKEPYRFFTDKTVRKFRKWFKDTPPTRRVSAARRRAIHKLFEEEFKRVKKATFIGKTSHSQIKQKRTEEEEKRRAEYFAEDITETDEDYMLKGDWSIK